jgi:putative membrane protein
MAGVDYLGLMLMVLVSGLLTTAWFFWKGPENPQSRIFAAPLAAIGVLALVTGLHMSLTWPIPYHWADAAFGEPFTLFGAILLATSLALAKQWSLKPIGVLALVAGLAAILIGIRIGHLGLTKMPALSVVGFVTAGLGGVLTPLILWKPSAAMRCLGAIVLTVSAAVWAVTGFGALWDHMESFLK